MRRTLILNESTQDRPLSHHRLSAGFTLAELLITIAIIGILAGIGIANISNVLPSARRETGIDTANLLNRAVLHYNQVNSEITIPSAGDTSDETSVLALLQTRNPAAPGSPYIPPEFSCTPSTSTDSVRFYWTGKFFKTIPEGTAGIGITTTP